MDEINVPGVCGFDAVVKTIGIVENALGFHSKKMLLRMALIESDFGTHASTFDDNFRDCNGVHSIGIWQITEVAFNETQTNPKLVGYRQQIYNALHIDWSKVSMADMKKPVHCCLSAYLYIKFAEKAWPKDAFVGWPDGVYEQATKWKHHFNRCYQGGLSIDGFVRKCQDSRV